MVSKQYHRSLIKGIDIKYEKENLLILLSGDILGVECVAPVSEVRKFLESDTKKIQFIDNGIGEWDSSLLLILYDILRLAKYYKIAYDCTKLPQNLQDLLHLAFAVDRQPTKKTIEQHNIVENVGIKTLAFVGSVSKILQYLRTIGAALWRFVTARSIMRHIDLLSALDDCGPKALGIVSLISFLVGLILAFVGAVQLQTFGAQIYVASLVTVGMCRIMGAIMVGIIMAGRTGSAYAATIGTMQVNEELDALETMGLSKIDFLVLPRLFSLLLAMPILTMLSDFMGMLGGAFVGVVLMNLPYQEYWKYAFEAFSLNNFLVGIFHGFCFGFIIALCGCYSGLTCGRNADSVGIATTRSVVNAIVWMIVITGIITVICQELGI